MHWHAVILLGVGFAFGVAAGMALYDYLLKRKIR
jgi:hypothetical protein